MDFGRAPRGDPRVPHASEKFFNCMLAGFHGAYWIVWQRGRLFGVDIRPRKYDLDLLRDTCRENKQKRQVAMGQQPTYWTRKPMKKAGDKHGWAAGWYRQYCDFSWKARRIGPAY